jgi:hypothetical protein
MLLHDPVLNKRYSHLRAEKTATVKAIIEDVVEDSRIFLSYMQPSVRVDNITPLLLHAPYQAKAAYNTLIPHSSSSDTEAQEILEQKLIFIGLRWNAGGGCHVYQRSVSILTDTIRRISPDFRS